MKLSLTLTIAVLLSSFSCSTSRKDMGFNQRPKEHKRLYSYPDNMVEKHEDSRFKRIVIASINDFEGNIEPKEYVKKDNRFKTKSILATGGIAGIKAYTDILRQKYQGNVVLVDSGNFLSQSADYNSTIFYANYLGIDVASLAPKDFANTDLNFLRLRTSIVKYNTPVVVSNMFNLKEAAPVKWEKLQTEVIKEVDGIKVGFIGIVSPKSVLKMESKHFMGLYFQNPTQTIIQKASDLRKQGAQVIVALFHSGIDCTSMTAHSEQLPKEKVNFDPNTAAYCDLYDNEISNTIKALPPNIIDMVVTGGGENKVANLIHGIPVAQNFGGGRYINWVELYFDTKLSVVDKSRTLIYQPVEVCHQFLALSQDCYMNDPLSHYDLVPAKFLGEEIKIAPLPIATTGR